ncbi:hypothetical protein EV426DRAFT_711742 [Tirmania nivea]|nr:hypothetical protein EV426DRAFT_711742 [Tirmania nivea]
MNDGKYRIRGNGVSRFIFHPDVIPRRLSRPFGRQHWGYSLGGAQFPRPSGTESPSEKAREVYLHITLVCEKKKPVVWCILVWEWSGTVYRCWGVTREGRYKCKTGLELDIDTNEMLEVNEPDSGLFNAPSSGENEVNRFKEIGDIIVQFDPGHAALPWAGFRFLLKICLDKQETVDTILAGLGKIALLIDRCMVYELLYLNVDNTASQNLKKSILSLYIAILKFLAQRLNEKRIKAVFMMEDISDVLQKIKDLGRTLELDADVTEAQYSGKGAGLLTHIVDIYKKREEKGQKSAQLSLAEARDLLVQITDVYPQIMICIDAMDEVDNDTRIHLRKCLNHVIQTSKNVVEIFVTTRMDMDILSQFENFPRIELQPDDNVGDINKFVLTKVQSSIEDCKLLQGDISNEVKEEICNVLCQRSKGNFQLAALQVSFLCEMQSESDVKRNLTTLPDTLTDIYNEIYNGILTQKESAPRIALNAFRWIQCSKEPLSSETLLDAVTVEVDTAGEFSQTGPARVKQLLTICRNLIILDEKLNTFRFAHLSVDEYLETKLSKLDSHLELSRVCFSLLCSHTAWNAFGQTLTACVVGVLVAPAVEDLVDSILVLVQILKLLSLAYEYQLPNFKASTHEWKTRCTIQEYTVQTLVDCGRSWGKTSQANIPAKSLLRGHERTGRPAFTDWSRQ